MVRVKYWAWGVRPCRVRTGLGKRSGEDAKIMRPDEGTAKGNAASRKIHWRKRAEMYTEYCEDWKEYKLNQNGPYLLESKDIRYRCTVTYAKDVCVQSESRCKVWLCETRQWLRFIKKVVQWERVPSLKVGDHFTLVSPVKQMKGVCRIAVSWGWGTFRFHKLTSWPFSSVLSETLKASNLTPTLRWDPRSGDAFISTCPRPLHFSYVR